MYVLKHRGVKVLGDEDFFPPEGSLHQVPADPPRWMGINVPVNNMATSEVADGPAMGDNNGDVDETLSAADGNNGGHTSDNNVPPALAVISSSAHVVVAQSKVCILSDDEVIMALNLSSSVQRSISMFFFLHLSLLDLELHTTIPSYIADDSVQFLLASISVDQNEKCHVFGPALPPAGLPQSPTWTVMTIR